VLRNDTGNLIGTQRFTPPAFEAMAEEAL